MSYRALLFGLSITCSAAIAAPSAKSDSRKAMVKGASEASTPTLDDLSINEFWINSWRLLSRTDFDVLKGHPISSSLGNVLSLSVSEQADRPRTTYEFNESGRLNEYDLLLREEGKDAPLRPLRVILTTTSTGAEFSHKLRSRLKQAWGNPKNLPDGEFITNVQTWKNSAHHFVAEIGATPRGIRLEIKPWSP